MLVAAISVNVGEQDGGVGPPLCRKDDYRTKLSPHRGRHLRQVRPVQGKVPSHPWLPCAGEPIDACVSGRADVGVFEPRTDKQLLHKLRNRSGSHE